MSVIMRQIARVSMLGIDVDARIDLAPEPCIEAADLGRLLEYTDARMCRRLVRRLLDDGRLSGTACHGGAPQNSADNSMVGQTNRPTDVFAVEVTEQHGVRPGTTEQLWLTERAALLVATASETERAWQVRTALVDFFMEYRRNGHRAKPAPPTDDFMEMMHASVQEMGPIRFLTMMVRGIDYRLSELEATPQVRAFLKQPVDLEDLTDVVEEVLEQHPGGLTARAMIELAGTELDDARGRKTTPRKLEKELATLDCIESEQRGNVTVWRLKATEST